MNDSMLDKLYNGELYPYSLVKPTVEEYRLNKDKAFKSYEDFQKRLPDELKEDFDELMDSHLDVLPFELEQTFIDGFKIGARIITEIFMGTSEVEV